MRRPESAPLLLMTAPVIKADTPVYRSEAVIKTEAPVVKADVKLTKDKAPAIKTRTKIKADPRLALTRVSVDEPDYSDLDTDLLEEMDQLTKNIDEYLFKRISTPKPLH